MRSKRLSGKPIVRAHGLVRKTCERSTTQRDARMAKISSACFLQPPSMPLYGRRVRTGAGLSAPKPGVSGHEAKIQGGSKRVGRAIGAGAAGTQEESGG